MDAFIMTKVNGVGGIISWRVDGHGVEEGEDVVVRREERRGLQLR